MIIETERLILRPWQMEDAESLFKYASDPDVGPIAGWPPHENIESSRFTIWNILNGRECYAICLKESGEPVGSIELKLNGYTDMTERDDECEMGFWMGKPHWGRGYIPEAARALLKRGFEELGMTSIWCGYYDGNAKSKRVQEKIGFRYHHSMDGLEVTLMKEIRTGHTNVMTLEDWQTLNHNYE